MSKPSPAQVRQKLRRLGTRRKLLRERDEQLHRDTREVLELADGVVPTSEAATLIGLNRSTIYEVYRGGREARKQK